MPQRGLLAGVEAEVDVERFDARTETVNSALGGLLTELNTHAGEVREGTRDLLNWFTEKERVEEILAAFDATGAYKEDMFHHKLKESFETRKAELDEFGLLKITDADKKTFWFAATLPELPALNLQSHRVGDMALANTVVGLEGGLAHVPAQNKSGIFHNRGADFTFKAYLPNADPDSVLEKVDASVSLSYVNMADVLTVFNKLQYAQNPNHPGIASLSESELQKELSGVVVRVLTYQREFYKVTALAEKVMSDIGGSETFFNNFVKSYFSDSECAEFSQLAALVAKNPEKATNLVARVARRAAARSLHEGSLESTRMSQVLEEIIRETIPDFVIEPSIGETAKGVSVILPKVGFSIGTNGHQHTPPGKEEEVNITMSPQTFHARQVARLGQIVAEARRAYDSLQAEGELTEDARQSIRGLLEVSGLNRTIEALGRQRNFYHELLELLDRPQLTPQDRKLLNDFILLAEQRQRVYELRHDKLTGLPSRYEFYAAANKMVAEAIKKETDDAGIFFVDLAFLNYFNKKGNRATGNKAIETAVSQLEGAFKEAFGTQWTQVIQMFRYGGDELVFTYRGGADYAEKIRAVLDNLNKTGTPIAPVGEVSKDYIPERVQYNYGQADMKFGKNVLERLIADKGVFGAEETAQLAHPEEGTFYADTLSKVMTRLADKIVDHHKVFERFSLLMNRYISLKESGLDKDWQHFETLLSFSGKALLGQTVSLFESIHAKAKELIEQDSAFDYWTLFKQEVSNSGKAMYGEDNSERILNALISELVQEKKVRAVTTIA